MNKRRTKKPEVEKKKPEAPASLWTELKRRHVIRVASVYSVVAWLVIQVAATTFESFGIPPWAFRFVVLMLILGLPVALVLAWALELTPEGVKRAGKTQPTVSNTAASGIQQKKQRWLSAGFAAALPTFIFGTLALFFYLRQGDGQIVDPVAAPASVELSIAVLPLVNMSDIDANAFFANGVHEDILTNLSRIESLKVVSRTSAMRYINSEMSLRDIGVALGVNYIVEGSVRRINNHVRVTVQLIDARNDTHLWANNYDRELVDVFATQSAVAREISNSLHLEIQPESVGTLQGMPTHSVKAYDLYLKARSIERSEIPTEDSLTRQRDFLEEALREDPDFVEAWAVLSDVYDSIIQMVQFKQWVIPDGVDRETMKAEFYQASIHALKKAVALNPDNLETLLARAGGVVGEEYLKENRVGDEDNTILRRKLMDYTLAKYPDSAMAWYVRGWHYRTINDMEGAKPTFKKALELDPLHARIVEGSLQFFRMAADEEMVAMLYDRLTQIAPEKGSELHLGEVSPQQKFGALLHEFAYTADPSLIDLMGGILSSPEFSTLDSIDALSLSAQTLLIQNDQSGLANLPMEPLLKTDDVLDHDTPSVTRNNYIHIMNLLLWNARASGEPEKATRTAELILQRLGAMPQMLYNVPTEEALLAQVYLTLGREDEARVLVNKLLSEESAGGGTAFYGFLALTMLDHDEAAEQILETYKSHPSWNGLDYMAIYYPYWRDVLIHPDIQAHYVKEGKWIDYLSERVPEYEQYRK